jgi:hypothetical protein
LEKAISKTRFRIGAAIEELPLPSSILPRFLDRFPLGATEQSIDFPIEIHRKIRDSRTGRRHWPGSMSKKTQSGWSISGKKSFLLDFMD